MAKGRASPTSSGSSSPVNTVPSPLPGEESRHGAHGKAVDGAGGDRAATNTSAAVKTKAVRAALRVLHGGEYTGCALTLSMRGRTVMPAMALRYRCILIDHDDTAVDSTAAIHYPAHLEALRDPAPRPHAADARTNGSCGNFHGIMDYLEGELRDDRRRSCASELEIWRSWTTSRVPAVLSRVPRAAGRLPAGGRPGGRDLPLRGGRDRGPLSRRDADPARRSGSAPRLPVGPISSSAGTTRRSGASPAPGRSGRRCGVFALPAADGAGGG